jgi:hypothetical protein
VTASAHSVDTSPRLARGRALLTLLLDSAAILGLALGLLAIVLIAVARPELPRDLVAYIRAGDALRAGAPIYTTDLPLNGAFLYSPVWAVLFGAISWIPGPLLYAGSIALNAAALRYVAGNWRITGLALLWPFTAFSVAGGNIDLPIAAALVLAWRTSAAPLAVVAAAKLAPILALPRARWREFVVTGLILVALTLPWWQLWPEWVSFLMRQPAAGQFLLSIPWWARLPAALALLLLRRPWASALAAAIATPALYWTSSVLLLAPLRLWLDQRAETTGAGSATPAGPAR